MDFVALWVMLLSIAVLGGVCTWMALRSAKPRLRWSAAAGSFLAAVSALAVAASRPAHMDSRGVLHEPGLAFVALAYLATLVGCLLAAWALHGWRVARSRAGIGQVASVGANLGGDDGQAESGR